MIDETSHRARIEERPGRQIRTKARADADGHTRRRCPASKPARVVRCELKPSSEGLAAKARFRIPVADVLRHHGPKVRTQESVTLPPRGRGQVLPGLAPRDRRLARGVRHSAQLGGGDERLHQGRGPRGHRLPLSDVTFPRIGLLGDFTDLESNKLGLMPKQARR